MPLERPNFEDLPLDPSHPKASAWGLWGDRDEVGSLNLLTADIVKNAAARIELGETIPLNLPLDAFVSPMNPVRKPCFHKIIAKGNANDDTLDMNTQGSSHWDGLRHYPYQSTLQYYNGVTQNDISGPSSGNRIGIQNLANRSIVGRGVLLDWFHWAQSRDIKIDHFEAHEIPLSQLLQVAKAQCVQFEQGDILMIRTGWLKAYQSLSLEDRASLPHRPVRSSCGVKASKEMIRWHWECGFAAVASDTVAYEAWPSPKPWGVSMHEVLLSGWGTPIGESFNLEVLAQRCAERGEWTFMFVSVPLNIPAGVASPPGAVAIM